MRGVASPFPFLQSAILAVLCSLAAVAGLAVVEGAVLMRLGQDWGYRILSDPYWAVCTIDFAVVQPCGKGVALVRAVSREPGDVYQLMIVFHGLSPSTPSVQLPWPGPAPRVVAAIPYSTRALVGCGDGEIYLVDAQAPSGPPRFFGRHEPGTLDALACSSDGQRMVSLGPQGLSAWDLPSRRVIWRRADVSATCAAFHPNAQCIVAGMDDGALVQIDALTGTTMRTIATLSLPPLKLDVSPDGERLAVIRDVKTAMFFDWQTGTMCWSGGRRGPAVAFSPVGDLLASCSYVHGQGWVVVLLNARTGDEVAALTGHSQTILGVSFSPDGSLYSWSLDGTIRQWNPALRKQVRSMAALTSLTAT